MINTITMKWDGKSLKLIDQRKLPTEEIYNEYFDYKGVAKSIKDMVVRGAPAIGVTAAFGYVLGAYEAEKLPIEKRKKFMKNVKEELLNTRPTAVNLFWALEKMEKFFNSGMNAFELEKEAVRMAEEDIEINRTMGKWGSTLIKDGFGILTHCNTGTLATVDYGTALGVIRTAFESGKKITVYADETRPYLQGARLTAWELLKYGIKDTYLISDNMAGWVMKLGKIDAIFVGADRIASNGDTANKIGTYTLSILAKEHEIPFYIVAPTSTIDINIESGNEIPIEERNHREVTHIKGVQIAPTGVKVFNPAFDVTPHENITAIVTEKGIIKPPYKHNIHKIFEV